MNILKQIRVLEMSKTIQSIAKEFYPLEVSRIDTIIKSAHLTIKKNDINYYLNRNDVQYIELQNEISTLDEPCESSNALNLSTRTTYDYIVHGRSLINSDPYYSYNNGRIAVLDTGVDINHVLLTNRFGVIRDCYRGTSSYCTSGTNLDPVDRHGHGSSSSSIVAGGNALGNQSRGVSNILMDSYKVYYYHSGDNEYYADSDAFSRAQDTAQNMNDRTILAEVQFDLGYTSSIATKTDNLFDLGFATIAAGGNQGPTAGSIRCPANAHKAIGVGAFDVYFPYSLRVKSGRGPTSDNRIKPDIIAPTMTRAADINTGYSAINVFSGTSGAVPYAAAAAAMLRDRIGGSSVYLPGYVYTSLINSSTNRLTSQFDNNYGAGKLKLATNSRSYWGRVVVNHNTVIASVDISDYQYTEMAVTIWWPESANETHKVFRFGMTNSTCGSWGGYWPYYNTDSVWQKHVFTPVCPNEWQLQIIPENNVDREQPVYYNITFWKDGHPS